MSKVLISKAIGGIGDVGVDTAMGGLGISQQAQTQQSTGMKAYNITGEVVGIGANIGVSSA